MAGAAGVTDADRVRGPGPADRDPARAERSPACAPPSATAAGRGRRSSACSARRWPASSALVTPPRRRSATHRATEPQPARAGSNLAWLRPALAVAGAVVIVVAGVYGLAQVRDNLVLELFPSGTPASTGPGSSGGGAPGAHPERADRPGRRRAHQRPDRVRQAVADGQLLEYPPGAGHADPDRRPTSPDPHRHAERRRRPTAPPRRRPPAPTDSPSTSAVSLGSSGIQTVAERRTRAAAGQASPSQSSSARQPYAADHRGVTTGQPG